jgi:lysine-specific demethylase 8
VPDHRHIPRVAAPVPELWSRHVAARQPVLVEGLFDDQPIRKLSTARAARRAIGDMDFVVQWSYTANLYYAMTRGAGEPERATLADYLDYVAMNPRTPRMCIEQPIAPALAALIEAPPVCRNNERTLMFIGNAGNFAHLHFDGDQRQVLMYQVFGAKRVVLIPPVAAKKLLPHQNFSSVCVQHMSERERRAFLRYVGGHECLVRPGQAILMPALFWHHVHYVETSLSVHFRFGQTAHGRFFDDSVHRSMYTQNVAALFQDERFAAGPGREVMRRLRRAAAATYPSHRERCRRIEALCKELYQELCPDGLAGIYAIRGWSPSEEEKNTAFYRDLGRRSARRRPARRA